MNSSKTHEALFLESQNDEMLTVIPRTFHVSKWKQRVSIIPCQRNLDEILQIVQIANVIVFTVPENGIDDIGFETLRIIRAQGFPSIMATTEADKNVVHHKKAIEKQLCYEFGEKSVKVIQHSKTSEVLRAICQIRLQEEVISRFIPRPYLLIDEPPKYVQNGDNFGTEISGYLRGGSLNANQLLHIPGYGDFQMHAILSKKDPHPSKLSHDKMEPEVANEILSSAEPGKQESLESENEPNPLDSEQPMFTHENIPQLGKKVPKGTSSYQATWILEEGDELSDEEVKDENTMDLQESSDIPLDDDEEDDEEEYEYLNSAESFSSKMEDKRKLEQEDIDFPDEIETPEDVPARVRFQKYRGLKSFRTSPWDPKEELPRDYARIYQFRSMKRTQNRVLDEHDGIETGTYITIQVINVPKSFVDNYSPSKPILAIGLFQYERKLSVLNFTIRRTVNYTDPIASKDELIFVCGSRWLVCNPLFSEHSATSDKHKYEKFWLPTTTSVATIYGPVMFSPCPLLIFKKLQPGETVENSTAIDGLILVGSGSLLSVDPDRLNIKKITLTGEPFKVLKRKAVIRRMFHNPGNYLFIINYIFIYLNFNFIFL